MLFTGYGLFCNLNFEYLLLIYVFVSYQVIDIVHDHVCHQISGFGYYDHITYVY